MKEDSKPVLTLTSKDFRIEAYCSPGKGGQNKNRRHTAIRITHEPSGCVQVYTKERDQLTNKRRAFELLCEQPKFRQWLKIETMRKVGAVVYVPLNPEEINRRVDEMMKPEYIKEEVF